MKVQVATSAEERGTPGPPPASRQESGTSPLVTVVVLNYNGKSVLAGCLRAVLSLTYSPLQIILVENGSTDGSLESALADFREADVKRVEIIRNAENLGYCDGFNSARPIVRGKYVMFLNNDAEPFPGSVQHLISRMESNHSVAMTEGKIINTAPECFGMVSSPHVSFSLGFFADGFLPRPGANLYDEVTQIFSPVGVWATCRVDVLNELGWFDSLVFWGIDIRELSWRMWRAGYCVERVPSAVTFHVGRLRTSLSSYPPGMAEKMAFHTKKNQLYFLLKHISLGRIFLYLPLLLAMRVVETIASIATGDRFQFRANLAAGKWILGHLDEIRRQRELAERYARVPEAEVFERLPRIELLRLLTHELEERLFRFRPGYSTTSR